MLEILHAIQAETIWKPNSLRNILKKFPKDGNKLFSNDQIIAIYNSLIQDTLFLQNPTIEERIQLKPIRTSSGVAVITVLTKPFPCPGKCIFCPNDVRMPKSYLRDEPGAQRAEMNSFDPYLQTYNRLLALKNTGHNVEKIELIILGGTWSFYPEKYQIWFIKRCFEAMNDFDTKDERDQIVTHNIFKNSELNLVRHGKSYNELIAQIARGDSEGLIHDTELSDWDELFTQHEINESAKSKCVGLVIETRPDSLDENEVVKIRKFGATKVQIGIQSLDDEILQLNKRGHGVAETKIAINLLRMAGFKIHGHWMPNLYGATVASDILDYKKLWTPEVSPDELKIYPTSVIADTELYTKFKSGEYHPYNYDELLEVLTNTIPLTPRFCRLTRIIRDIPSTDIVAGNKLTNFRQIAEQEITNQGKKCECIRCREIKNIPVEFENTQMDIQEFNVSSGKEYFISFRTKNDFTFAPDKIVGFLRLFLPDKKMSESHFIQELKNAAIIREIHVYGNVVGIGDKESGKSQHIGLGSKLILKAQEISSENNYEKLSVISAIGTREYYRKKGFEKDGMYMSMILKITN